MGILYNRFNPQQTTFLLPYSNRSKIITYLTPDNFNGSSSTTWGDEWPKPFTKVYGLWDLASDGKSVCIYNTTESSNFYTSMVPSSDLSNFTVYIVAKYAGLGRFLKVVSNASYNQTANVFYDSTSSYMSDKQTSSDFTSWEPGNSSYFRSDTSVFDAFQAYAISRQVGSRPVHILSNLGLKRFPMNAGTFKAHVFTFNTNSSSDISYIYIKFLAIVSESESDTVLQNNINYIRTQLNLI